MNNRLQQFLEIENLTPARLADMLGVQRSGMSHILSGRNKPGYDFIYKLLTKFPALSADWFITGKGKPYKEMNTLSPAGYKNSDFYREENGSRSVGNQEKNPLINQLNSRENENLHNSILSAEAITGFSTERADSNETENNGYLFDNDGINSNKEAQQLHEIQINGSKKADVHKNRSVKRVIIFYSDGTFDELFPSR